MSRPTTCSQSQQLAVGRRRRSRTVLHGVPDLAELRVAGLQHQVPPGEQEGHQRLDKLDRDQARQHCVVQGVRHSWGGTAGQDGPAGVTGQIKRVQDLGHRGRAPGPASCSSPCCNQPNGVATTLPMRSPLPGPPRDPGEGVTGSPISPIIDRPTGGPPGMHAARKRTNWSLPPKQAGASHNGSAISADRSRGTAVAAPFAEPSTLKGSSPLPAPVRLPATPNQAWPSSGPCCWRSAPPCAGSAALLPGGGRG